MDISDVNSQAEMDISDVNSQAEMDGSYVGSSAEMEARQIYEDVHREFYEWQQADVQASIDSLACKNPDDSFPDRGEFNLGGMDACLIDDEDCIIINIENKIAPHPPYTSCAPVSRNVLLPDDAGLGLAVESLSHVPYADHPAFKKKQFLRDCIAAIPDLKYAWQSDFLDPDVEIMRIEVVKRLYNKNIPLNTLGGNLLGSVGHASGLLWAINQRDRPKVLDWFTGEKEKETLQKIENEIGSWKTESVFDAINTCEPAYCFLCERVACGTHRPEKDEKTNSRLPVLLEKVAKLSAEELHSSDVTPCGADCFKHLDMDRYEDESKGTSDIDKDQFIIGVLKIDPDILPCDLSFTSKLPCNQIFLYRARFLKQADDRPGDAGRTSSGPSHLAEVRGPAKRPEQSFTSPNQISQSQVDHEGPPPNDTKICNNVDVQCSTINDDLVYIRRSKYGSGAFSSSNDDMSANTYLGEYHGQIKKSFGESAVDDILAKYTKRNYAFSLNDEVIIDAASMGNVTRYLNHKPESKKEREHSKHGDKYANCVADVVHVNEEKHIVLKTGPAIEGRNQLTLCYGDGYWKSTPLDESTVLDEGLGEKT
ncbi:hypothetical protein BDZ89DRAFT_1137694 [Hymenopellis radicata]|nr:hypothetical protein BDZ89DRAFT_1137694 [Hymenopellis radicata]